MGYQLRAAIAKTATFDDLSINIADSKIIALEQGLSLLPITENLYDYLVSCSPSVASKSNSVFWFLSDALSSVLTTLSEKGAVAYVEAEYFGGIGEQSAVVWKNKIEILGPIKGPDSINKALKRLSVKRSASLDEFDIVGLSRHRHIEDWLS